MVKFPGKLEAEAVIFDFDGVIVDTEPLHYKAFQHILEPLGAGFSWNEYIKTYMGFDDRDAFTEAFASIGKPIDLDKLAKLVATKASVFQDVIKDGVTSYSGVVELIGKLHIAKVPLAICSGALHSDIVPILDMLKIRPCFDIIVAADDVAKSKPDPECYTLAFKRLSQSKPAHNITPAGTIAIEDTPAGIKAALGAGLRVVAVTNSYSAEYISMATQIVKSLNELLNFEMMTAASHH